MGLLKEGFVASDCAEVTGIVSARPSACTRMSLQASQSLCAERYRFSLCVQPCVGVAAVPAMAAVPLLERHTNGLCAYLGAIELFKGQWCHPQQSQSGIGCLYAFAARLHACPAKARRHQHRQRQRQCRAQLSILRRCTSARVF